MPVQTGAMNLTWAVCLVVGNMCVLIVTPIFLTPQLITEKSKISVS